MEGVLLRMMKDSDRAYVVSSWVEAERPNHKWCPAKVFRKYYRGHVFGVLSTGRVVVACNEEDEGQVFGYAVVDRKGKWVFGHVGWMAKGTPIEGMLVEEIQRLFNERRQGQ